MTLSITDKKFKCISYRIPFYYKQQLSCEIQPVSKGQLNKFVFHSLQHIIGTVMQNACKRKTIKLYNKKLIHSPCLSTDPSPGSQVQNILQVGKQISYK